MKIMARKQKNSSELTAASLLHSLRVCGGSAPLHRIRVSRSVIQSLVDSGLVKVQNTGCGFLLEIVESN
jgi:RNA-binding protein YlmH